MRFSIALANGCFDLFHYGHYLHLKAASRLADKLIVSVTLDECVNKGPGRPVFTHHQRADILRELRCVDGVILCKNALDALEHVNPDIFVKGSDYQRLEPEHEAYCKAHGIQIAFTNEPKFSSSRILDGLGRD